MSINEFIGLVDKIIAKKCGVSVHDLPDFDFSNYFEEDFDQEEARSAAEDCAVDMLSDLGFDDDE
jgi:hypothetical protein